MRGRMLSKASGFTLVELLVVLAIIAILAAIVVPNVAGYLREAQATRALAEIQSIETALTKMLTDSDRSELAQLFDAAEIDSVLGPLSTNSAQQIYTEALYALLLEGRGILNSGESFSPELQNLLTISQDPQDRRIANVLNDDVVSRLGTGYLEIGEDPWGNLYNIYPGPWRSQFGTIPFRVYRNFGSSLPGRSAGSAASDALTLVGVEDPESNLTFDIGFPAGRNQLAFIWSSGQNLVSGQGIYINDVGNRGYNTLQDTIFFGGGDDINNWDGEASWDVLYN